MAEKFRAIYPNPKEDGQVYTKGKNQSKYPVAPLLHGPQHRKSCQLWFHIAWIEHLKGAMNKMFYKRIKT